MNSLRLRRTQNGQSLSELAVGLIVVIPIMLILLDCGFLAIGVGINDSICRDAARAAASGPPGQMVVGQHSVGAGDPPKKRALDVIKKIYNSGLPVKVQDSNVAVKESLQAPLPAAPIGGSVNGTVEVSTTVDVFPPFLVGALVGGKYQFKSRHSCPFTYVMPNTQTD